MASIPKPYAEIRRKILFEYLEKYRDTSTRSIAKIIFRDYPEFFTHFDHARQMVRLYRGEMGNYARSAIKETKFFTNDKPMA